jgi:glucose uptake protein
VIVPSTVLVALLCTILSMICWGTWANTFKWSGKWRFELFYYDYAAGVVIAAVLAAITFGSMGDDLSVYDNFLIAGKMKILYGLGAGAVFNLANMLLVAAISVAGMAVAFPVGIGLALVVGVIWNFILNPQGNPELLFAGVALVVCAIIVDARAYGLHGEARGAAAQKTSGKGIALSLVSGLLMGSFYPLVEMGKQGENGLGPYSIGLVFSVGVFISTFFYNIYFLNLPVEGKPIGMFDYFTGSARQHLLGIAGGILWCVGAISNFAAASAPPSVQVGPAISYALGQGATLISALWGLLYWKEFAGATVPVKRLIWIMLLLFVVGLAMISVAPLFAQA